MEKKLIFVYGTLKRGYGNNRLLQNNDAEFVAVDAVRVTALRGNGVPFATFAEDQSDDNNPYLLWEVWSITEESTLARLDGLEGHPVWYFRMPTVTRDGRSVETYTYRNQPQGFDMANSFNVEKGVIRWGREFENS